MAGQPGNKPLKPREQEARARRMTQESDHPIASYAAGWALAEVAMWRMGGRARDEIPFRVRNDAFERAQGLWATSIGGFGREHLAASSSAEKAVSLGFQLRSMHALASVPLMKVIVRWQGNGHLPEGMYDEAVMQTKSQLVQLGAMVCSLEAQSGYEAAQKEDFANRLTANLLLQSDSPSPFAVIPSLLRHDKHRHPSQATALTAVSAGSHHRRTHIQVLSSAREHFSMACFPVIAPHDLVMPGSTGGTALINTLQALVRPEDAATQLHERSHLLIGRLAAFSDRAVA